MIFMLIVGIKKLLVDVQKEQEQLAEDIKSFI